MGQSVVLYLFFYCLSLEVGLGDGRGVAVSAAFCFMTCHQEGSGSVSRPLRDLEGPETRRCAWGARPRLAAGLGIVGVFS